MDNSILAKKAADAHARIEAAAVKIGAELGLSFVTTPRKNNGGVHALQIQTMRREEAIADFLEQVADAIQQKPAPVVEVAQPAKAKK
jgi:hypothetical protein